MNTLHTPVLMNEVLKFISPKPGEIYLDGTFGAGGYSEALLRSTLCQVYAIDQDSSVKQYAEPLHQEFPNRLHLYINQFSKMSMILADQKVDAIVLDLGVSSMQLEEASRGFSFMKEGPLDMRMSQQTNNDASLIVNAFREEELANIIYQYSDERYSRKIAAAIVKYRKNKLIKTTQELANIVRSVVSRSRVEKIDPATRTFQALRIWVNNELQELEKAIDAAVSILKIGGRLLIVSFHSLEDRIVKKKFNLLCGKEPSPSRYVPDLNIKAEPKFEPLHKKIIVPAAEEIQSNPRARSARLRVIRKVYDDI